MAEAIVIQAVYDFQSAVIKHRCYKGKKAGNQKSRGQLEKAEETMWDVVSFFTGDWIKMLTKTDGQAILDRLCYAMNLTQREKIRFGIVKINSKVDKDQDLKEVNYGRYCPSCKYKNKSITSEECSECLNNREKTNTQRPINWVKK